MLAFSFCQGLLLVNLFSIGEFRSDSLWTGTISRSHPWVSNDVGHAKTLVGIILKHASDQVLELLWEEAFGLLVRVRVSPPEEVGPVAGDKLVVGVLVVGMGCKGRMTSEQGE